MSAWVKPSFDGSASDDGIDSVSDVDDRANDDGSTGKTKRERKPKNRERRNAGIRKNYALDKMQKIENELAALEGRTPKDVISEYQERKAKEDNTIDVEVIEEESTESSDRKTGPQSDLPLSSLPALLPKIAEPQQDSNRVEEPNAVSNSDAPQRDSENEYVNPYPYLSADWWEHCTPTEKLTRCRAISTNGERCRSKSITGGRVCRQHGGLAPHVKLAARNRIENAADQMAEQLLRMAIDPSTKDSVKLAAIRDALDRAGLKAPEQVVVSAGQSSAFEDIAQDVGYSGIQHTQPGYVESEQAGSIDSQGESDRTVGNGEQAMHHPSSSGGSNQAEYRRDSNSTAFGGSFNDASSSSAMNHAPGQSHTAPAYGSPADERGQRADVDSDCDGPADRRRASREFWDRQYRRADHVTGEDAIEAANAANFEAGAIKALPPGRKRR